MKKTALALGIALAVSSSLWADSIKLTTATSALVDKVGSSNSPGVLFKFDLPVELQKARIDLAYLRFKVETDTTRQTLGLLVRPMLQSWTSGAKLSSLSDSVASPFHANFGRLSLMSGAGKVEITQVVKAWQTGELANLGMLVYPVEEQTGSFQLQTLPDGSAAELEIFYTAPPVVTKADSAVVK